MLAKNAEAAATAVPLTIVEDESLPACLERTATAHGARPAIVSDTWQPTFAELNATANRLAHTLIARGCLPGERVAILMDHDAPAIGAIMGVLKAGAVVVVLNPTYPELRLRQIIDDAEPALIIADRAHADSAAGLAEGWSQVVGYEEASARGPAHNPAVIIDAGETSFLVYTSGSTGSPKAVMKTHRQVRRVDLVMSEQLGITASDRILLLGALSHGQALNMLSCSLARGAALCPFPAITKGVTGLARWIADHGITIYASSASIFRNFTQTLDPGAMLDAVRGVWLASETATDRDFRMLQAHFSSDCVLVHTLSSSETGNIASHRLRASDDVPEGNLPVGRVTPNMEVSIVDAQGRPVPFGDVGEIVIKSRHLAAGYWRNPSLTAEKFSGPLDERGTRTFFTGDMGRITADGLLVFIGRHDARVKIRGNRISLAEVEDGIRQLPGIANVAVEAIARENREPLLAAFVVAEQSWSPLRLRRALRSILPDQMVPSSFVMLESLPLTPGGKIDRAKLRDLRPARSSRSATPPQTDTQRMLAALWADAFEVPEAGLEDDFFELGGDSLIAAVVAARVHAACGVELELRMFSDHPTLAQLADAIDGLRRKGSDDVPLVAVPRDEPLPICLFQEEMWESARRRPGRTGDVRRLSCLISGPLDRELLRSCLDDLTRRHESLRTTFAERDGKPVQVIHPFSPVEMPYLDLAGEPDAEARAGRWLDEERNRITDLAAGPLVRWSLARIRENEYWLMRAAHHIVTDSWSTARHLQEIGRLYEARLYGSPSPLPEVEPLQYGDYAAWQAKAMRRGVPAYDRALAFWKGKLAGMPLFLRLPFERPQRSAAADFKSGRLRWGVDPGTSLRLNALGQSENATYYVVRLAAFVALLAASTGQSKVVVSAYMTNRSRAGMESMSGFLANVVLLPFRFDRERSFREWLSLVKAEVLDVAVHGEIPFHRLRRDLLRLGVLPRAREIIFNVSRHRASVEFGDLRMTWLPQDYPALPFARSVTFDEHNDATNCIALFDARVHDPDGVRDFLEGYKRLLDSVSRHPDLPMWRLLAMSGIAEHAGRGWIGAADTIYRRVRPRLGRAS